MAWCGNAATSRTNEIARVTLLAGLLAASGNLGSLPIAVAQTGDHKSGKSQDQIAFKKTCDVAEQFSKLELWEDAKTQYNAVLGKSPDSACALNGLQQVLAAQVLANKNKCDIAANLAGLGLWEDAKAEYKAVLDKFPTSECAVNGFKEALTRAATVKDKVNRANAAAKANHREEAFATFDDARKLDPSVKGSDELQRLYDAEMLRRKAIALANLGFPDDALKEMKGALEKNPSGNIPLELEYLSPGKFAKWWSALRQEHLPTLSAIGEVLLLAIAVLVLISLLRKVRAFYRYLFPAASVDVGTFLDDSGSDSKQGDAFAALLGMCLYKLQEGPPEFDLKTVTSPTSLGMKSSDVPLLTPPNLKWLGTALGPILDLVATPPLVVGGRLYAPADLWANATLTLQLTRGTSMLASQVLRLRDFGWREKNADGQQTGDAEARARKEAQRQRVLNQLALVAAVWVHFEAQRVSGKKDTAHFGTMDWRSCAYFQTALRAQTEPSVAAEYYLKALQADPENCASRVNLAKALVDLDKDHRIGEAIAHLEKVLEAMTQQVDRGAAWRRTLTGLCHPIDADRTPYVAMFLRAIFHYEYGVVVMETSNDASESARQINLAEQYAQELVERIEATLKKVQKSPACRDFQQYLSKFLSQAKLIHAGFMVASRTDQTNGENLIKEIADSHELSADPVAHYNLACSFALLAEHKYTHDSEHAKSCRETSLRHLERAFWLLKTMQRPLKWRVTDDLTLKTILNQEKAKFDALWSKYSSPTDPSG